MSEIRTLGDFIERGWAKLCTGPFGSALHKHEYVKSGVSVVPAEAIIDGELDKSLFNYVGSVKAGELGKYRLSVNDIVFARRGAKACGLSAIVREEDDAELAGTGLIYLKILNKKELDPYFIFLAVSDERSMKWLKSHAIGATMPNLNGSVLKSLPVTLPNIERQKRIASQHRAIASKLRLNKKINLCLEQIAQALFKSWFVDFEPVKAKIAARKRWQALQPNNEPASSPVCYAAEFDESPALGDLESYMNRAAMQAIAGKTSDQLDALREEDPDRYHELYETAELFPSAMQDSELGEIPAGWTHGCLADIATYESERVQSEKLSMEDYVSTENMLENKKGICEASSMPSSATVPSFSPGQILVSNIRPYFKKIWLANKFGGRSPDVLGIKSVSVESSEFVYNLLHRDQFFDYMMLTSKGVKMPRGDKKAIMEFQCSLPTTELIECFSAKVREFYLLADCRNQESKRLASIRDTLLPKLLSGELTPSEVEEAQAEATA